MARKVQRKNLDTKVTTAEIKATATKVGQAVEKKAAEVKKTTEDKVAEVKKSTEVVTAEVKRSTGEAVAEVQMATVTAASAVKKVATKATSKVKKEIKASFILEYEGRQIEEKEMIAAVKKVWTKSGNKIGAIKTMELYVKPEDSAIYFVINETETGKAEF